MVSMKNSKGSITVIYGEQRGDEGKGRFVDMLAPEHDIVARYNGGHNAGHTVMTPDGRVFKLHLVPSGITYDGIMNVIGNGTVVDPLKLIKEIETIRSQDVEVSTKNLKLSSAAHLVLPHHIGADEIRETGAGKQGSTKSGIAQVYAAKAHRSGIRVDAIISDKKMLLKSVKDELEAQEQQRKKVGLEAVDIDAATTKFEECIDQLAEFIEDTVLYLNEQLKQGKKVLAEGAQAFLLDVDHGMYPYTTSSSTSANGVPNGLGVPSRYVDRVIGVSKAVQSHVGGGPFVTEIFDEATLENLHGDKTTVDAETGTTTGRVRRLGYYDIAGIRRAQLISGNTEAAITKLDWVSRFGDEIKVCVAHELEGERLEIAPDTASKLEQAAPVFETLSGWSEDISSIRTFQDLPKNAQKLIEFIEEKTGVPITMIGVGPGREEVITRNQ